MGNFARALHHLDMKDVKRKRLEEIAAQKLKEKKDREEKKIIQEISKKYKSDWKREIYEGMTSSAAYASNIPAEGDVAIETVDPLDSANYSNLDVNAKPVKMFAHIGQEGGVGDDGVFDSAFVGTVIRDSGSGTGSDGGFDVGGKYLAFQGTGAPNNNARFATLGAIDSSQIDTLTITAIVGNDNNGGETPDLISECLFLLYKTPAMDRSTLLHITPDIEVGEGDGVIIRTPLDGQDGRLTNNGGLNNYSITIPEYARVKGTNFILYQNFNSGSEFDNYGITDIQFKRRNPVNVVVPLDDPEAISFVRVGSDEGDPKKRKKKLNDQLAASDEYTSSVLGDQFPGEGARVDGEDPFKSAPLTSDDVINASPIGKDEVKKSFGDFTDDTEKQKAAEVEKLTGELDNLYSNPDVTLDDFTGEDNVARVERILKLDPNNIQALHMRSLVSTLNGDQDAAIVDAEKAYEIDPDNEFTKPTLEYAYSSKISSTWDAAETMGDLMDDTELMNTLDKAIKLNPDDIMNYWYRSHINESNEDYEAVVEDLEKILEIDPEDSETELRLGEIKQKQAEKLEREQKFKATTEKQEAKRLQNKGIGDYYDNPGFEFEPDIEPIEMNNWDKNESRSGILDLYKADYETAKATIANLPKQSETIGATYNGDNIDYVHLSQININIESRDVRFKSPESMSQEELQRNLISLSLEIEDQKYWINDLGKKLELNVTGAPGYVLGGTKFTGEINGVTAKEVDAEYDKLQAMLRPPYKGDWKAQNSKVNKLIDQRQADNEIRKLNAEQYQLITQYNKLYNAFMGVESDPTSYNLPETIQKFNDDEKLFDKLKTETKLEDGILKKVLGRMLDVFKDKRDVMLAVKKWALVDMANAETYMENWAVQIALSMLTNTPIRIDESTISDTYKKSFARNITPGYFVSEKTATNPDGIAIPIVEEEVLYADDNFYIDEKGNTVSNIGPNGEKGFYKKNTTMQVFSVNGTRTTNIFQASPTNPLQKDPLSTVGKMQFQVIYPKKGEPYMLVKDHAYWNMESDDPYEIGGEANDLGERAKNLALKGFAYTAAALSAGSNLRWFGQENFGNMKGYPKNIRGDVITRFEIPFNLLSPDVQEYIENNKPGAATKTDEPKVDNPKPKSEPKPRSGSGSIAGLDEPLVIDKDKKNNVKESTLFEKLNQKRFFNPNDIKPTFPENPPPQLDPKTGMHPRYGKNANRYKKLDPISANAMPPTGDPETDAVVDKQRTKPKTFAKFKKKIKENFTAVPSGPTNSVSQTFQHVSGQTFSFSGIGGQETHPSTVTVFGETIPAPNYNQLAIAGYAKPIVMQKKDLEDVNPKLDASQEFAQKVGADVMMNARVKTDEVKEKYSEEGEMKIVDSIFNSIDQYGNVKDQKVLKKASDYNLKLKNNQAELNKRVKEIDEYRVKQSEWEKKSQLNEKIIKSRIQSNISKVKSFVGKYGEKLSDSYPIGSSDVRIAEGGKTLVVISHSGFNYDDSKKFNVRVYEAEPGKTISKKTGNFGYFSGSIADNPFNKTKSSGQATIMYAGVGAEIENRMFEIQDIESEPMPKIPPYLMKNQALGWYNAPQSITDNTKSKIITGDFARNVLGAIGSVISSLPNTDRQGYEGDIEYAAKLSKDMMDGNLTVDKGPQSKSFNKRLLGLISKNPDRNSVTRSDYAGGLDAIKELPVRLAIQSFEWNATEEGILVNDNFDFDINISGGALSAIPGVQRAIKMVSDAMRMRSVELGFNQVESQYSKTSKKLIYNNMASPEFSASAEVTQGGQGGKPLGSTTQRGGKEDPYIKAALASNTSVDGFDKDIEILIPWSQIAIDAPELMSKKPTGSNKNTIKTPTDRTGYGYDTKGKLDSSGYGMDPNRDTETEARPIKSSKAVNRIKNMAKARRQSLSLDEPIVRRKKKRG